MNRLRLRAIAPVLALGAAVAGCTVTGPAGTPLASQPLISTGSPRPTSPIAGRLVDLPVSIFASPGPAVEPPVCAPVLQEGPIYLRAIGDRIIGDWGGRTLPVTFPMGYRAVFDPEFVAVITDRGDVWARAGDDINSYESNTFRGLHACGTAFW